MKTVVVFTTPRRWTLVSWLIRLFTRSSVSHVGLVIDVCGVPVLFHSTFGGVQMTPVAAFERTDRVVAAYRVVPELDLRHAIAEHLGQGYDYPAILGFAWLIVFGRWLKRKAKNPLASPGKLVCSELVLHADHASAIHEWRGLDPERTHPQILLDRIRRAKGRSSFEAIPAELP